MKKPFSYSFLNKNFLLILIYLSIFYLFIRNLSSFPINFADEWLYSHFSVFEDGSKSVRTNYFYYIIYSLTSQCGNFFLQCGRAFNLLFYSIGIFTVFLLSRKYLPKDISLLVSFIALIYPNNAYTIYFMPESMFFCFFWIFVYFLINFKNQKKQLIFLSFLLALTFLIKPHILIVIPGLLVVFFIKNNYKIDKYLIKDIALFALYFIFFKYLMSTIYSGKLNFFDASNYHDYSASFMSLFNPKVLVKLMPLIPYYILNHLKGIFLSLNILLLFAFFISETKSLRGIIVIKYFFLITLFITLITIAIFQVEFYLYYLQYSNAPYEVFGRLSQRHYDFIFPGIIMIAFIYIFHQYNSNDSLKHNFSFSNKKTLFFKLSACLFFTLLYIYKFGTSNIIFTDAPTLASILRRDFLFLFIVLSSLILLIIKIPKKFIYLHLAIMAILMQYNLTKLLTHDHNHSIYDDAGIISNIINPKSKVMFYGFDQAGLYKSLFYRPDNSEFRILTNDYKKNTELICKEAFDLHLVIGYSEIKKDNFKSCNIFLIN